MTPAPAGMAAGELVDRLRLLFDAWDVPFADDMLTDIVLTMCPPGYRLTPAPVARERVEEVMALAHRYAEAPDTFEAMRWESALRAAVEALAGERVDLVVPDDVVEFRLYLDDEEEPQPYSVWVRDGDDTWQGVGSDWPNALAAARQQRDEQTGEPT